MQIAKYPYLFYILETVTVSDTHRDIQNTVKSNLYITDNDSKNGSHRQSQGHWQLRTSEFNSDRIRDRWLQ